MGVLKELLSTVNRNIFTISTKPMIHILTGKILFYLHKTSTHPGIYSFKRNHKSLFTIRIYWTYFYVNLILSIIHLPMHTLFHMKLSYTLMGRIMFQFIGWWFLFYFYLPSHIFLIRFWNHQLVINLEHRLRGIIVSWPLTKIV